MINHEEFCLGSQFEGVPVLEPWALLFRAYGGVAHHDGTEPCGQKMKEWKGKDGDPPCSEHPKPPRRLCHLKLLPSANLGLSFPKQRT